MNKHAHRLVFDRRRGMCVAAHEHARSSGKAANGQTRAVVLTGVLAMALAPQAGLADAQRTTTSVTSTAVSRQEAAVSVPAASRSVSSLVQSALTATRSPLPTYTLGGKWALNVGDYTDPTLSADGKVMTLLQSGKTIVLNWDSFDVAEGYKIRFEQVEGGRVLNRVHNTTPSLINGMVSASGEIMLENTAGVIFGQNARVDARSMVATALKVSDSVFEKGIRSMRKGEASFGGDDAAVDGFVAVQKGAEIKSLAGGDVILVAPRVVNEGKIETPEGQAILAAGKTVYLYAPLDLAQRGLLVAVDNFNEAALATAPELGTTENAAEGKVLADKGTINLVGAAIRQKGQLTATTAIKGKNGAIFLSAMKDAAKVSASSVFGAGSGRYQSDEVRTANTTGSVELTAGSITEVLPSTEGLLLSDADKAAGKIGVRPNELMRVLDKPVEPKALPSDASDEQKQAYTSAKQQYEADLKVYDSQLQQASDTFYRSRIDVVGNDITLRSGAILQAPSAEVNILAASNWQEAYVRDSNKFIAARAPDDSRIIMEADATVDVSGLDNLQLPASRNQLEGRLFSIELADAPVQRNGVLYRANLLADARRRITMGDVSGLYSQFRYSAAEYATTGGFLNMQSQGAMLVDKGARIDFSGGMVTYDAGQLTSSVLLRNGAITRIENANSGVIYDGLVSDPTQSDQEALLRRGLVLPAQEVSSLLEAQKVGMSAGVAKLAAPVMSLGATLDGRVSMSEIQRQSADVAERDKAFMVNLDKSINQMKDEDRVVNRPTVLTGQPYLYASLKPTAGLLVLGQHGVADGTTGAPSASVQQSITVSANATALPALVGSWTPEAWQALLTDVGTDLKVSATQINEAGLSGLRLAANQIILGAEDASDLQLTAQGSLVASALSGIEVGAHIHAAGGSITLETLQTGADIRINEHAALNVAGTVRDEREQEETSLGAVDLGVAREGGTVTMKAARSINMATGSQVDVSGSLWRNGAGTLTQGKAGKVALQINQQAPEANGRPQGRLQLGATLSAFDHQSGGTLELSGLPTLTLGGEKKNEQDFAVGNTLFADRGFGSLDVKALGDIDIVAGAQLKPQLVNRVPVASRLVTASSPLYELKTWDEGRRQPFKLSLDASVLPATDAAVGRNGLQEGANLRVGAGALVDVGLGGSIQLKAGGSIDMAGTLQALGGKVSLALSGTRGAEANSTTDSEALGYREGQRIHLAAGSLIDVSGASKSYRLGEGAAARDIGEVLAGGNITLGGDGSGKPVRGQLLVDEQATLRLQGASAWLNRNPASQKTKISASAGTLNIQSTDGFQLLGGVEAQAPDTSVAGGTLNIVLSQEGTVDRVASSDPAQTYPTGDAAGKRSIRIAASRNDAQTLATTGLKFGEGVLAAEHINQGGFDRIGLRADDSVQLRAGADLKAPDSRTRLQSVVLDTSVVDIADGTEHTIQAHHVGMGPKARVSDGRPLALPQVTPASERAGQGLLVGTGQLNVQAGLIEVAGDTAVQGINRLTLDARLSPSAATAWGRRNGEIRFLGQASSSSNALSGQLSFVGELNMLAGQVYASTLSDVSIKGFGAEGSDKGGQLIIAAPDNGSSSQTPLSALATLRLNAKHITIDGNLSQPFGAIVANADTLTLTERAALSVSGDGRRVPVGTTLNQNAWVYGTQGTVDVAGVAADLAPANNRTVTDLSQLPINKQISLNGKTLTLDNHAVADVHAGGDLLAWEFKQGVGGSTDTYLRKDVFAILPNYNYDFAPFDTEMRATTQKLGTGLKAGDQVTITTDSGVLGVGTYTLMDARYGILPGAVLVSASSMNLTTPLRAAIKSDDGSVVVSGFRTSTGTAQQGGGDARLVLNLEPEATARKKSDILITSGNAYRALRANRSGEALVQPGDAGRISLVSTQGFDWSARFNLKGSAQDKSTPGNFSAGQFDLVMPHMVVQADTSQPVPEGAYRVSLNQLNELGADSLLLGGVRTTQADGSVLVSREANQVAFQADVNTDGSLVLGASQAPANLLSTEGELLAVAKDSITVDNGLTIQSTGKDTGAKRRYVLAGNGSALQVGHLANTDVAASTNTGSSTVPRGELVVGSNTTPGQVQIKGASIALDATQRLAVAQSTQLSAQSLSLGGQRLAIGADATNSLGANTVDVTGNLLTAVNRANQLKLRAYESIDLYGVTQLGSDSLKQLTLDAPQLLGLGAVGDTAVVVAREVVLTNTTGNVAAGETGASSLKVAAKPVLQDGHTGGLTVATSLASGQPRSEVGQRLAFANTTLESTGDIVLSGRGQTQAQGDLTLSAARVTAASSADQTLQSPGTIVVQRLAGSQSLGESLGVAGQLQVNAGRIEQKGLIDIESGRLGLHASGLSGQADALVFAEGSETRVDGRLKSLSDTFAVASPGGQIVAEAQQGRLVLNGLLSASAPVMPDGVTGDNPYAGSITLKATGVANPQNPQGDGAVVVGATARINLGAALGKGGSLRVDARQLVLDDAARLAAATSSQAAQSGIDQLLNISANTKAVNQTTATAHRLVDIRVRRNDVSLNTAVESEKVIITADGGKLDLGFQSLIQATAPQGGDVRLYARDDLTVQTGAQVLASSTREGANGGEVLLSSTKGKVLLGQATLVADSAADAADGRITIRAGQAQDEQGNYTGDVKVGLLGNAETAVSGLQLKAGQIDIEAVRIYTDDGNADASTWRNQLQQTSSDQAWGLDTLLADADAFATDTNRAKVLDALGLSGRTEAHVKAGAEVQALGDLAVGNGADLVLDDARPGGQPLNLTVRAAGDIQVDSTVSDGFTLTGTTLNPLSGNAASLRFAAGADLVSANMLATQSQASQGHITLAAGKFIRTTAGSIDVHAAGDVRLMAPTASTTSAIYVAGRTSALAANERFTTTPAAATAYTNARFTERGGHLSIQAGGHVGSYQSVKTEGNDTQRVAQQLTQMTGNYFYHGGNPNAALAAQRVPVAWWTGLNAFRQGVGSFGGGNISITAGEDVSNLAVVAPTSARMVQVLDDSGQVSGIQLKELNGGNIEVQAGGHVDGGVYFLGRGLGRIAVGGVFNRGADAMPDGSTPSTTDVYEPGAMLGLMSGGWDVSAVGDLNLSYVFNPTVLPFRVNGSNANNALSAGSVSGAASGLNASTASAYFTYADDAKVSLTALQGDVNWESNTQSLHQMHKTSAAEPMTLTGAVASSAAYLASMLPSNVSVVSLESSVNLDTKGRRVGSDNETTTKSEALLIKPSSVSDVVVYAGKNLNLSANLQLLDQQQALLGLPDMSKPAALVGTATSINGFNLASLNASLSPQTTAGVINALRLNADINTLKTNAINDSGQLDNSKTVRLYSGQDIVFDETSGFLRTNRPTEIVAGRDLLTPAFVGQNFTQDDTTLVRAGRDILGNTAANSNGKLIISGPGEFRVEAGRDILLSQSLGVLAVGNQINTALPTPSAKITLSAGNAHTVNVAQWLNQYGDDAAVRTAMNSALADSQLPPPNGASSWAEASFTDALAAFRQLKTSRQTAAVDGYLNAKFVQLYIPDLAGRSAAYYRSDAFSRLKREAMWQQIISLAGQAVAIAISSDAQEEASRALQRKALFAQAATVADLAGFGASFAKVGNIDLAKAKVHNEGVGGGDQATQVDDSQGGIDVLAAGQVTAGLPSNVGEPAGFINFKGGSFRSLTSGDFLAGDQKVVVVGKGNLYIYTTDGSIDSGKGSNTAAANPVPRRAFNALTGQVETVGQPPTSGSGFQSVEPLEGVATKVGLYAPNGEIRALDAFIKGSKVEIAAPKVVGADNIANASGTAPPPPPAVNLSLAPKVADTSASANKAAEAGDKAKAKQFNSVLTVDLLGFGDTGVAASETPCQSNDPSQVNCRK